MKRQQDKKFPLLITGEEAEGENEGRRRKN